jgi:uncharacterized membrane protein
MAVKGSDAVPRIPRLRLMTILAVLAGLVAWFIAHSVIPYLSYDAATYDELWPRRYGFIPHVVGGTTAILAGLVQLWLGLTGRIGALHRVLGRVYVSGVALASAGAFYLAVTIDAKYFAYAAGLFGLACAWVVTTSMALVAIHHRAIEQHREWMIRSYIVTFAFVTFRLLVNIMLTWKVAPETEVDTFVAFACWAVPLVLAEPLIQLNKIRRPWRVEETGAEA